MKKKPTIVPVWIPDNLTNIADPGSKAGLGYENTGLDPLPAPYMNFHLNRLGQWAQLLNRMHQVEIVVDFNTGNDTTGDGSNLLPYKTVDRALEECAEGSYALIVFGETVPTIQTITKDVDLRNQAIAFVHAGNTTLKHHVDYSGAQNEIRGFDMVSSVVISYIPTVIGGPTGTKSWSTAKQAPYRSWGGKSAYIAAGSMEFPTGGASTPVLYWATSSQIGLMDVILTKLTAPQVITHSTGISIKAYVKNVMQPGEALACYTEDAGIDNSTYWLETHLYRNPKWQFNFKSNPMYSGGLRKTGAGGPEAISFRGFRGFAQDLASTLTADQTAAYWRGVVETSFRANFESYNGAGTLTNQLTKWVFTSTVNGNFVEDLTVELVGGGLADWLKAGFPGGAALAIPFYIYVTYTAGGGTGNATFFPKPIQRGERNPGIITNLASLK